MSRLCRIELVGEPKKTFLEFRESNIPGAVSVTMACGLDQMDVGTVSVASCAILGAWCKSVADNLNAKIAEQTSRLLAART